MPVPVVELGEIELRALLDEAIAEALELADKLAEAVKDSSVTDTPASIAKTAANYLQARTLVRQCRGVIAVEAGRR